MASKKIVPLSRPKARSFKQFEMEVAALLCVQGYTPAQALGAVRTHVPLMEKAWKMRKAPCGTADQLKAIEQKTVRRMCLKSKIKSALRRVGGPRC